MMKMQPISIELEYDSKEELVHISKDKVFVNYILKKSYDFIEDALTNKLETTKIFDIVNLGVFVTLKKSNYIPILYKILKVLQEEEEYEMCIKVKKLIDKYGDKKI